MRHGTEECTGWRGAVTAAPGTWPLAGAPAAFNMSGSGPGMEAGWRDLTIFALHRTIRGSFAGPFRPEQLELSSCMP